eukprot:5870015-Amphidinium_carterae.1
MEEVPKDDETDEAAEQDNIEDDKAVVAKMCRTDVALVCSAHGARPGVQKWDSPLLKAQTFSPPTEPGLILERVSQSSIRTVTSGATKSVCAVKAFTTSPGPEPSVVQLLWRWYPSSWRAAMTHPKIF